MADTTKIAWTRSSFNPWIGCTKVSPGCDHCYAEVSRPSQAMGIKWGAGQPRHRTSTSLWRHPLTWDRACAFERGTGEVRAQDRETWTRPGFWPVFPSLCDPFDNEVPEEWRRDFWQLILETPNLTWLLLTKRIGNAAKMLPQWWAHSSRGDGVAENVWLGASIVNPDEMRRDLPKLRDIPASRRFVSYEPAIEGVDWTGQLDGIHQVIVGGESSQGGARARPFDIEWARSTVRQCKAAGVAVFVKQAGSFVIDRNDAGFEGDGDDHWPAGTADKLIWEPFGYVDQAQGSPVRIKLRERAGADPAEWPSDLRIQEFP